MKLGSFFVELNFKAETYKVKDFARTIANLPFSLAAAGAALVGMDLGFMALTSSTLDMANSLQMFRAQTGMGTDELERWQMVARRVGVDNTVVTGSFERMISAISQLKTFGTGPAGEMFGRLGISGFMNKTPNQLMDELRSKSLSMDRAKFAQIAGSLIDPAMMRVFESPLSEPTRREKLNPLYGQAGQQAAADLTAALSQMADVLRGEFLEVFKKIEPDLRDIARLLGLLIEGIGGFIHTEFSGYRQWGKIMKRGLGNTVVDLANYYAIPDKTIWQPAKAGAVTVHQNFYGDVDKSDIDAGRLDLEHSLIRASRQLNRGGR